MTALGLADELGTTDRTLRRLAEVGTIRSDGARGGLRKALPLEASYLRTHWQVLSGLREALRTEPRVTAALLFGSMARGDDTAVSDVDLVVAVEGGASSRDLRRLSTRLSQKVGRPVDLFSLDDLLAEPERLGPVLDEGRPVVDRALVWPQLRVLRRRWAKSRSNRRAGRGQPGDANRAQRSGRESAAGKEAGFDEPGRSGAGPAPWHGRPRRRPADSPPTR